MVEHLLDSQDTGVRFPYPLPEMKWFNYCSFCDIYSNMMSPKIKHQESCVWDRIMRTARWMPGGVYIALSGKKDHHEHG